MEQWSAREALLLESTNEEPLVYQNGATREQFHRLIHVDAERTPLGKCA